MQILLIHCCCFIFRPEGTTTTVSSVVERRAATDRSASDPRWRHSNPDSQYGFRTTPFLQSCQYQQRLYQQQQQQPPQVQWRYDGIDSHYALPDQLPRYLWGPPPPYSQPPSLENIREAAASAASNSNLASTTVASGPTSPTLSNVESVSRPRSLQQQQQQQPQSQQPTLARTTKSGLLVSSSSEYSLNNNNSSNNVHSVMTMSAYDESVKSAVHVYEQANELRRKRNKTGTENAFNYCNSLPTRKLKKKSTLSTLAGCL